jgi:hypothetical protein
MEFEDSENDSADRNYKIINKYDRYQKLSVQNKNMNIVN